MSLQYDLHFVETEAGLGITLRIVYKHDNREIVVRFQQLKIWKLRFSGLLRSEYWSFLNDVSRQLIRPNGPIVKASCLLQMVPIGCPKTSVTNYWYSLRNSRAERSSDLPHCGSLKSQIKYYSVKFKQVLWSTQFHIPGILGSALFELNRLSRGAKHCKNLVPRQRMLEPKLAHTPFWLSKKKTAGLWIALLEIQTEIYDWTQSTKH
jgi:hypothetical protein